MVKPPVGSAAEEIPVAWSSILGQFHGDLRKARKAFARFVRKGLGTGHRAEFYQVWEQRVLGNQAFAEDALGTRRQAPEPLAEVTVEQILRAVTEEVDIPQSHARAASRARGPAQARAMVTYLARELAHLPLTTVAPVLRRDPVTLSHAVTRLERALNQEPQMKHQVDRITRRLRRSARGRRVK